MRALRLAAAAVALSAAGLSIVPAAGADRAGRTGSLSGAWLFGDYQPEPKAAVASIPQRCWNGGVDFTLAETGKKLTGEARWIDATGGVPRPPRDETETLIGTRDGSHVLLTGEHKAVAYGEDIPSVLNGERQNVETTVKYDLRLDPKTGHLVGTRDGQPFWLARFKTTHADCGSPPP